MFNPVSLDAPHLANGLATSLATASPPPFTISPPRTPRRAWLEAGGHRLHPFDVHARAAFATALRDVDVTLSDYSFANNIIWLSLASGFWQVIEDCFCLFMLSGNGLAMMLPPLGEPAAQRSALRACVELMAEFNGSDRDGHIDYVYPGFVAQLDRCPFSGRPAIGDVVFDVAAANADYIYATQDLIDLKGHPYRNKRNEINQFIKTYPNHALVPFRPEHRSEALDLLNAWMQQRLRGANDGPMGQVVTFIDYEHKAIQRAIDLYDQLGLVGLSLFVDGKLAGFTFGERIRPDVASVIIEKTDFAFPGAAQFIFREFSKVFADCAWINVGDDLGFENLRRVKLSYRPVMFGEKVVLHMSGRVGGG